MEEESVFSTRSNDTERNLEKNLRPASFADFIGQDRVKDNLRVTLQAATKRGDVLDHLLLSGPPGLGKTTLSRIIAEEMQVEIFHAQGPSLDKTGDLAGILTSMKEGSILFIDEIHRLRISVEECLYTAMEDFVMDIMMGEGASARTLRMQLPRFTLIGATTREGLLSKPFRERFGVVEKLEAYPWQDLQTIVMRSAKILNLEIEVDAAELLARRSRGTPRLVNRFLRRVRDLAEVSGDGKINVDIAIETLERLGVDAQGLDKTDREILKSLVQHNGQAVGLKTIAVIVGETTDTVEEVFEPFLIREGYISKTPQGRIALAKAYDLFGQQAPE